MISTKLQHNSRTLMAVLALAMPMAARAQVSAGASSMIESHARWSTEMRFPFALLSDTTHAVAAAKG
jgi:peroxiredoxin